ncbi:ROK family protein [Dongshaea marina]|uniref:ROK family protein n=1 Tax=Dongshaea marina TaxID=2047966 RepID=UPI000D3E5615|nr:ROK family protein [Dongshaea marina]
MSTKSDTAKVRQHNLGLVYQVIDHHQPLSRTELSRLSGLSTASITKISRELLDARVIRECGELHSLRGRHPILLELDSRHFRYLAMRLGRGYVAMASFDLKGRCLRKERYTLLSREKESLTRELFSHLETFTQKYRDRLLAMAVSLPGRVDDEQGWVHHFPFYDIHDWPLKQLLEQTFSIPCFVSSSIHPWIMAERAWGAAQKSQNALLILIQEDIGAGVILDGQLVNSRQSRIGSLNHLPTADGQLPCYCGHQGCARTEVTTSALERSYLELTGDRLSAREICELALAEEGKARELLITLGHELGALLATLVIFFNPQTLLFSGELLAAASILFPLFRQEISARVPREYFEHLSIEATCFYEDPTRPTAILVQEALFDGFLLSRVTQPC